jgi:SAM-dependent methyltransferase
VTQPALTECNAITEALRSQIEPEQTVLAVAPDAALEASLSELAGSNYRRAQSPSAIAGRFVAETVDVVVAAELSGPGALAAIGRVLRPGGRLVLGDGGQAAALAAAGFFVARAPGGVLIGVRGEFAATGR